MHTSLVIMAAGLGSRFGTGIKQLEPVGLHDEIIMDYSIHDAIQAGFDQLIFIIRKDIEADFKARIGNRIEQVVQDKEIVIHYCFQEMDDLPQGFTCPATRKKPWGTGQAVLAAKAYIDGPFCVINADDYYGKHAFSMIYDFLQTNTDPNTYCMAGFILKNTLSENGTVTRGLCQTKNDFLTSIVETHDIEKTPEGAQSHGQTIDVHSHVSMNMWGFTQAFLPLLEEGFKTFLSDPKNHEKGEYLLPIWIGDLLKENRIKVKVLETPDTWFGVTYQEDKPVVEKSFRALIKQGVYPENLYSDL